MIMIEQVELKRASVERRLTRECTHEGLGALRNVGSVSSASCECKMQWAHELEAFEACLPVEFWDFDPATIDTNLEIFEEVIRPWPTIENLAKILKRGAAKQGYGLFLSGPNGTGKTTFLSWICMQIIRNTQFPVYYTTTFDLIDDIQSTFGSSEFHARRKERLEALLARAILVIDELGKEEHRDGDTFAKKRIEKILRTRDAVKLPTLIASNIGLEQIEKVPAKGGYGPDVASLIKGNMLEIHLEPGDKRAELGEQKAEMT